MEGGREGGRVEQYDVISYLRSILAKECDERNELEWEQVEKRREEKRREEKRG